MGRVRLVRGHGVQLVRWRAVEGGWVADVRRGRRIAEDADGWTVLIGGRNQRFDRADWTEFIGELEPPGGLRPGTQSVRRTIDDAEIAEPDPVISPLFPRSEILRPVPSTRPIIEPAPGTADGIGDDRRT
jgi:hypothetical protein